MEPSLDHKLAEVVGVLLGDGCISEYRADSRVFREIAFTGNRKEAGY